MDHFVSLRIMVGLVKALEDTPRAINWTWDTLKGFGSAQALKSSYVFLFVVPVVARALSRIPPHVTVPLWGKTFEIPTALPFSWVLLFACACLASIGNIMYVVACPRLVREFADFPSFTGAARSGVYLLGSVRELALVSPKASLLQQLESVRDLYNDIPIDLHNLERTLQGVNQVSAEEFYFVRDAANLARPLPRLVASLAYVGAFVCLSVIAIQNVTYVVEHYGKSAATPSKSVSE